MTKRDFFLIVLKLAGLYFFFIILTNIISMTCIFTGEFHSRDIYIMLYLMFLMGILVYLFFRKPQKIVDIFKLDKGFDTNQFEAGGLHKTDFAEGMLFLLGAYIFVTAFPQFLVQIFLLFKSKISGSSELMNTLDSFTSHFGVVNYYVLLQDVLFLLAGYLIMTNYDLIVRKFFGNNN